MGKKFVKSYSRTLVYTQLLCLKYSFCVYKYSFYVSKYSYIVLLISHHILMWNVHMSFTQYFQVNV